MLAERAREGFVTPRIPVDGIVGVLQEVGATLEDETIRVACLAVRGPMTRTRRDARVDPRGGAAEAVT